MAKSRAFEYTLVALLVVVLVGVFGHYVAVTHQKMAQAQLSTAYHAMRTAMVLVHTRCQVDALQACTHTGMIETLAGLQIHVEQGYPAPSMNGIVLASGLDANIFLVREIPGAVHVYMVRQPYNEECKVVYLPPRADDAATVDLYASSC